MELHIFTGRLGQDPEVRNTNSGKKVVNISVAVDKSYKKDGEWVNKTTWLKCVSFNENLVEYLSKNYTKGQEVVVKGEEITASAYTNKEGKTEASLEMVLDSIEKTHTEKKEA